MKSDRFWEIFWLSFLSLILVTLAGSGALFFTHIQGINTAAVGVAFDPTRDPFEATLYRQSAALIDGYAYRNALPLGLRQWAWDSQVSWSNANTVYEGSGAIRANFLAAWGGFGINNFNLSINTYHSISLAIHPDAYVGDLYIELYDSHGASMGRQSLGWYTDKRELTPDVWHYISLPIDNLLGSSTTNAITGVSISTKNAGVVYVDAIEFKTASMYYPLWVQPAYQDAPPFNPFATSTPVALPYTATFAPSDFSRWYSYYGHFVLGENAFVIGPKAPNFNDSISVYRGGRGWSDYRVETELDWGLSSTFSILMRVTDANNFVACTFSYYGQTAQIYHMKNGVSTQIIQSPTLGIRYFEPWEDVKVGGAVQGNKVSCSVNGEQEIWKEIPGIESTGTVGLEAWDQNANSSAHTIHKLEVRQMLGE